jgi:hypothetical protein
MFPNKVLVPYYLMSSYLYYEKNTQVLTDAEFDKVCFLLHEKWDEIDHPHKKIIEKENLLAQTGYNIEYPNIVKLTSMDWSRDELLKEEKVTDLEDLFE